MTKESNEEEVTFYKIDAQVITRHVRGIVARCPHVNEAGEKCPGVITTLSMFNDVRTKQMVTRSDEMAVEVFLKGEVVNAECGKCGSKLVLRKSSLIKLNRRTKQLRRSKLKVVK